MKKRSRWLLVPLLALALVAWMADLTLFVGSELVGVAYAKGGGGGGGGGNGGGGGHGAGGGSDAGRGGGESGGRGASAAGNSTGRGVGNAVSEAATSTAHAGKAAAQEAGFKNLGQAVSSAVHEAQQTVRDREVGTRHHGRESAMAGRWGGVRIMPRSDPTGRP